MRGIILAAGRGSRLGTLTDVRPKGMVLLGGQTLLKRQLQILQQNNIYPLSIVRGYQADAFPFNDVHYFDNPRWAETNMVMSLCVATSWLEQDACLVTYADILYDGAILQRLKHTPGDIIIPYNTHWEPLWAARFDDPLADAESFQIDASGRLTDIGRRVQAKAEIQGQYMGLITFTPTGWQQVYDYIRCLPQATQDKLDMTALLQQLLAIGVHIQTIPCEGWWLEVDNARDLALYESWLVDGTLVI